MKLLLAVLFLSIILVSSTVLSSYAQTVSKGQITIDKAITKSTSWDSICDVGITTGFNQSLVKVYHKDVNRCNGNVTNPIPPPVPPVPPVPVPTPIGNVTKIALVGDLSGTSVRDLIKKSDPNLVIGLGDLGYKSDLSSFKKEWGGSFKNLRCVVGNHDAPEDGSSAIYKEALAYCGNSWHLNIGTNALILGFNTNGDISSQLQAAQKVLTTSAVKTVIAISHKNGHVFPNAHHPAEAKALYSQLEAIIPAGVKLIEVSGHNHDSASAPAKNWYIAGMGGKSSYACGTDVDWTFCDNKSLSYLELTISNKDGATAAKFIN